MTRCKSATRFKPCFAHHPFLYPLYPRYLTGFTLFLSLILNRTYSLIIDILRSDERLEIMREQATKKSAEQTEVENKLKERVAELEKELESKKNL